MYIHIYVHTERERDRETDRHRLRDEARVEAEKARHLVLWRLGVVVVERQPVYIYIYISLISIYT